MSDLTPRDAPLSPSPQFVPLSDEEMRQAKRQCRGVKDSRLREAIERLLLDPSLVDDADAATVLGATLDVSAWSWRKHRLALWALGRMPLTYQKKLQTIEALSDFLKESLPGFYKVVMTWWLSISLLLGIGFAASSSFIFALFMGAMSSFLFVWLTAAIWGDLRFNLLRATSAETLGLIALPECAEPITRAMYEAAAIRKGTFDRQLRRSAELALPAALATLTPAHYLEMGAGLVPNLCLLLDHVKEPLQLKILDALGKMGDGRAAVPVQRFIVKTKNFSAREAARRIQPILEQRHANETMHNTLLRASSKPDDAPNVLLRPVYGGSQDAPQHLLRPVEAYPAVTFDLGENKESAAPRDNDSRDAPPQG